MLGDGDVCLPTVCVWYLDEAQSAMLLSCGAQRFLKVIESAGIYTYLDGGRTYSGACEVEAAWIE